MRKVLISSFFGCAACFAIPLLFFVIPPFYEPLFADWLGENGSFSRKWVKNLLRFLEASFGVQAYFSRIFFELAWGS